MVSQPKGFAVGEIRIFPIDDAWRDPQTQPGEWSGCLTGSGATVPDGGLRTRLLREVRVDAVVSDGRRVLSELIRHGPITNVRHPGRGQGFVAHALRRVGVGTLEPPLKTRRAGRRRLPDADYRRLVDAYTRHRIQGRRGTDLYRRLATTLKLTESQARNRIARAREYGFLQHLPAGRRRRTPSP